MAYIGVQPTAGQYRKLDDISAGFNGSTTSFTTSVGGTNVTAGTAQQLIVSVGGVIQEPDADYTVSTNTITFTTAPTSGLDFFAILMGDALNTVTPSDGSVTTSKLAGSLSVGLTAGSASTPALFFTGDTNNGIFSPSTDAIAVTTAGSERLRVTSAGLVGIGTSSPSSTAGGLDISSGGIGLVVGADGSVSTRTNSTDKIYRLGSYHYTNAEEPVCIAFGQNLSSDNELNFGGGTAALNAATYIRFFTAANNTTTTGTERMRITSAGNVGIGTTSPAEKFDVRRSGFGNVAFFADDSASGLFIKTASGVAGLDSRNNTTALNFLIDGSEKARLDTSGRLLVGTSTARGDFFNTSNRGPSLQVEGTTTNTSGISVTSNQNNDNGPEFNFGKSRGTNTGSSTIVSSGDGLGRISFQGTDGSELVPAAYIEATVDGTPGTNDMPGRLVFSTTADGAASPTERMRIASTGELTFPATSSGYTFNATSSVTTWKFGAQAGLGPYYIVNSSNTGVQLNSGSTAWSTSSDERLKENLQPIPDGLNKVSSLRACTGKYITDELGTSRSFLIAQDVQAVLPEAVDTEDPDNLSLRYTEVIPLLVAALKESKERIETLEAKVAALELS